MSQMSPSQPPQIKSRIGAILRATSGNFLEQFDFFLFGFYASYIAKAFFPSENETAALLNTFGVFWLGALMRPVGAIVLGAYIDRIGRRQGLIVTLAIMALGTVFIAICPTYASIGIAAPIFVLVGRLLQGFAAGGWRIPFFIGCIIIPFIFVLRRTLEETPAFLAMNKHPTASEVFSSAAANWRI